MHDAWKQMYARDDSPSDYSCDDDVDAIQIRFLRYRCTKVNEHCSHVERDQK